MTCFHIPTEAQISKKILYIGEDNYPLLDFNIHSQYCKKIAHIQMKSKLFT